MVSIHDYLLKQCCKIMDLVDNIVMVTDHQAHIVYVNPAFERASGYSRDEIMGQRASIIRSENHDTELFQALWQTIGSGRPFRHTFVNRRKNGENYFEQKEIHPIYNNAQSDILGFMSIGTNLGSLRDTQSELQGSRINDAATQVQGHAFLYDRLSQAMARSRWNDRHVAVIHLDVDHFQLVNDALGFQQGDFLLQAISDRVRAALRDGDTVAQVYGDGFLLVLQDLARIEDVSRALSKLRQFIAEPFVIDGRDVFVSVSAGISLHPQDGATPQQLLTNANNAMCRAKTLGAGRYEFYQQGMAEQALQRLRMESALHHAFEADQFEVHYQPQLDMRNNRIIGLEALMRWRHPEYGDVSPQIFIPILEDTDLMKKAGEWVLWTACKQMYQWRKQHVNQDLILAVNISSQQFACQQLVQTVARCLEETGLPGSALEIEITETTLMQDYQTAINNIDGLHRLGVKVAIDDFGTGYSSFGYLRKFGVDVLKIDKCFIDQVHVDERDRHIVKAMITMAHKLGMQTVAEGVEQAEQGTVLDDCGCDLIQGYMVSRPLPGDLVLKLLEAYGGSHE